MSLPTHDTFALDADLRQVVDAYDARMTEFLKANHSDTGLLKSYRHADFPATGDPIFRGRIALKSDRYRGAWIDNGSVWVSLGGKTFDIDDFHAIGDGRTDDTPAFRDAIAAVTTTGGAGIIELHDGNYLIDSLDLSTLSGIWVRGQGPNTTRITCMNRTAPGITLSTISTNDQRLSGFSLYHAAGALPGTARSGNYGVSCAGGVGFQGLLENLRVRYFADTGIYISGSTGPTVIRDVAVNGCANYGVAVVGSSAQDVRIDGGSIHDCWGGVFLDTVGGFSMSDTDVELGTDAQFPAAYLTGACYGLTFVNVVLSISHAVTPAGVLVLKDGPSGCVFVGGTNAHYTSGGAAIHNILCTGSATQRNSFHGGLFVQPGSGGTTGYYAKNTSSVENRYIDPLLTSTFAAGLDVVLNDSGASYKTFVLGVGCADPSYLAGGAARIEGQFFGSGYTDRGIQWGPGSPEGVYAAAIGSIYGRTDGGAGTCLYVKESGSGNTGWIAK